jgi:hypothetical protein
MSTTPSSSPQPSTGAAAPAPAKSGSGGKVFLWILGGCLTIVVLGIVAFAAISFFVVHKVKQVGELAQKNPVLAAAKVMVALNPDLETVSSDDSTGTIVVHDKKTGKTSTMKVDPDKKVMVITDPDGKTVTMKLDPSNNRLVVTDDKGKTATITADQSAGSVEIKGEDGSVKIGGADKPPDWVPVYPGATPTMGFSASSNLELTGSYTLVTNDSVDKVMSYYSDRLKSGGFNVSNTTTNSNGKQAGVVSGTSDGDKRTAMVTVSGESDGTHVGVAFNSKKQQN